MLTCRQVPDALEKDPKSFKDKVQLRLHLFICKRCRALASQYKALSISLKRLIDTAPQANPELVKKVLEDFKKHKKD
jgi:predicted anti-sigma-YlaC factor YlaD